jgi:hypothetical protein
MHAYFITKRSSNKKTGPILVTTSPRETCSAICPLRGDGGCYSESYPLGGLWDKLDGAEPGQIVKNGRAQIHVKSSADLMASVAALRPGELWRHNQAGDLPGRGHEIDAQELRRIVRANRRRRGFTYTHKPVFGIAPYAVANRIEIHNANRRGFTINLSGNNLHHADKLAALGIGPVVVVLPETQVTDTVTPSGRAVRICPATIGDTTCAACGLCAIAVRDFLIGFPAHGNRKARASAVAASC